MMGRVVSTWSCWFDHTTKSVVCHLCFL